MPKYQPHSRRVDWPGSGKSAAPARVLPSSLTSSPCLISSPTDPPHPSALPWCSSFLKLDPYSLFPLLHRTSRQHGGRKDSRASFQASFGTDRVRGCSGRRTRAHHRPPLYPPDRRPLAHTSPDLVPKQPQDSRPCQGFRPPLQHGSRERERDVDRDSTVSQRQLRKEGQQGPLHLQAVPSRRLGHSCFALIRAWTHWGFGTVVPDRNARNGVGMN